MIFQGHRLSECMFRVQNRRFRVAEIKRVSERIFRISKNVIEASKKFLVIFISNMLANTRFNNQERMHKYYRVFNYRLKLN